MIHALLPVYLVTVLGASALTVGIIEGIAEATASDHQGVFRRAFRLARQAQAAGRARLRSGRVHQAGLSARADRSAGWSPRASSTASARASAARRATRWSPTSPRPSLRGASFGLRQSLDTVGAFVGPLLAIGPHVAHRQQLHARVLGRGRPGFPVASALIVFAVREPERPAGLAPGALAAAARRAARGSARLLVGGRRRRRVHAGAIQRGVPGAARAVGRAADRAGPGRDGGDERRLCALRLSGRRALRTGSTAARLLVVGFGLPVRAPTSCWPAPAACSAWRSASSLWGLHMGFTQGFSRRWSPTPRRRSCAARPLACST